MKRLLVLAVLMAPALGLAQPFPSAVNASGTSRKTITAPSFTSNSSTLNSLDGSLTVTGAITDVALATPVNGTITSTTTGGSLATGTHYYRVAATNAAGTTLASTETSKAVTCTGSHCTITVPWAQITGATGYKVYCRSTGAELLCATITSGSTLTWTDDGSVTPSGALPTANTTSGFLASSTTVPLKLKSAFAAGAGPSHIFDTTNAITGTVYSFQVAGTEKLALTATGGVTAAGVSSFTSASGTNDVLMAGQLSVGTGGATSTVGQFYVNSASSSGPSIYYRKSRGTYASPTAVSASDNIGSVAFSAYDNGSYQRAAHIDAIAESVSGTAVGGQIQFWVQDAALSDNEVAWIRNEGTLNLQGMGIRVHSFNTQPTCDSTNRGYIWTGEAAGGASDTLQMCLKAAADTYAWRTIYTAP